MTDTRRLPKPVANEWDWQLQGSCQGLNSNVFFHPDGERGSSAARFWSSVAVTRYPRESRTASGEVSPKRNAESSGPATASCW
jgi:hypothetical protein